MAMWYDCKTAMLRPIDLSTQYYKYISGSIITMLRDGFLRISVLWLRTEIMHFANKFILLAPSGLQERLMRSPQS